MVKNHHPWPISATKTPKFGQCGPKSNHISEYSSDQCNCQISLLENGLKPRSVIFSAITGQIFGQCGLELKYCWSFRIVLKNPPPPQKKIKKNVYTTYLTDQSFGEWSETINQVWSGFSNQSEKIVGKHSFWPFFRHQMAEIGQCGPKSNLFWRLTYPM